MADSWSKWVLLLILLTAAVLRFHGLDWDGGIGAHPDERYIVDTAGELSFGGGLNPFETAPLFPYGHLPLYVLRFAGGLVPTVDPSLVGRAITAFFDVGTVALTFALAKLTANERVGLLAAALVGLSTAHIQQAHFYTADVPLTFFATACLLFAVRFAQEGRRGDLWLAGGLAGLAVAAKATGVYLVIPLGVACLWRDRGVRNLLQGGAAAAATFAAASPFALIDLGTFLRNVGRQGAILRGASNVPFTMQYRDTLPYIYPWLQQLRWGLGWLVGGCVTVGLIDEAVGAATRARPRPGQWIMLAWVVPTFALVGALHAKFPRYVLPILPVLVMYGARFVAEAAAERRVVFGTAAGLLVTVSLVRAGALMGMYRSGHPWVAASAWLSARADPGSRIAVEAWDHPLPVGSADYELLELPVFEEESSAKWERMNRVLDKAEYLVVASRRGYGALARRPSEYPRTAQYYADLFRGELGFVPVACFGRFPRLGPLVFKDDPTAGLPFSLPEVCRPRAGAVIHIGRLDESFVVYDHPQVVVFETERG
jgi:hypothetical protein